MCLHEISGDYTVIDLASIVVMVGCANYPAGGTDVARITEEFLKRRFIVGTTGCSAMDMAMTRDEDGLNLYE